MTKISTGRPHKTLRAKDADFTFSPNGLTLVPRASFEVSKECPREYRLIIAECIGNGWLKPVAHMRDEELTWELLKYETL
jgi:hypothetical protein